MRARRSRGRTDAVDAKRLHARSWLGVPLRSPRQPTGLWRRSVLKMVRDSAVHTRTTAINQLKAILVTADPALRESLRGVGCKALIRRCAQLPETSSQPRKHA